MCTSVDRTFIRTGTSSTCWLPDAMSSRGSSRAFGSDHRRRSLPWERNSDISSPCFVRPMPPSRSYSCSRWVLPRPDRPPDLPHATTPQLSCARRAGLKMRRPPRHRGCGPARAEPSRPHGRGRRFGDGAPDPAGRPHAGCERRQSVHRRSGGRVGAKTPPEPRRYGGKVAPRSACGLGGHHARTAHAAHQRIANSAKKRRFSMRSSNPRSIRHLLSSSSGSSRTPPHVSTPVPNMSTPTRTTSSWR